MAKRLTLLLVALLFVLTGAPALHAGERVLLGERVVTNRTEKEVFEVEGRDAYGKIQFETRRAGVEIIELEIHYEGGGIETLEVKSFVDPGAWSDAIDIDGRDRRIGKVVLTCKASPKGKRKAVVRLYGIR